jgi:D-aminopeptidase
LSNEEQTNDMKRYFLTAVITVLGMAALVAQPHKTLREWGFPTGIFTPGANNAITDVPGVTVGHVTLIEGDNVRTGVTAIVPHQGNLFRQKVPAAIYVGNGFGKLAGETQVRELGNIETPIVLTNTLSVAAGIEGVVRYMLMQPGNEDVRSVNAVVGETNDGRLNDIRGMHVTPQMVIEAINKAHGGAVEQGCVGAGTGTICFGFKGGIGTSSRVLPESLGGYTVGVLVQTNYGGILEIDGVQVGQKLQKHDFIDHVRKSENVDGSCMMVVITDAPLDSRNLERVAKRAMMGMAKTGGIASNGSGDYVIALSVAPGNLIDSRAKTVTTTVLANGEMSPIFAATIEATAEALWNSLFMAEPMTGRNGYHVDALPVEQVLEMLRNR